MSLELHPDEEALRLEIQKAVEKARRAFAATRLDEDLNKTIYDAGVAAHKLHMRLKKRGHEPKHHAYMIKNRELAADHPEFYMHFHPLEDLLKFLANPHANDDPKDVTIGAEFQFNVYSRRWGHRDPYTIKRTTTGWDVRHTVIGGPCDKGGRPFLFENLRQDFIQHPNDLSGYFEWLWEQAASRGLSQAEMQAAIQQLADWVSLTEEHAPSAGVWEGF